MWVPHADYDDCDSYDDDEGEDVERYGHGDGEDKAAVSQTKIDVSQMIFLKTS